MIQRHHYGVLTRLPTNDTYQTQIRGNRPRIKFGIWHWQNHYFELDKQLERGVYAIHTCKINLDDLAQDVIDYPDIYGKFNS